MGKIEISKNPNKNNLGSLLSNEKLDMDAVERALEDWGTWLEQQNQDASEQEKARLGNIVYRRLLPMSDYGRFCNYHCCDEENR